MSVRVLGRCAVATLACAASIGLAVPGTARATPVASASAPTPGWVTTATPSVPVPNGGLVDVSCRPDSTCVAVGSALDTAGVPSLVVQRRTAGTWSRDPVTQPTAQARFSAVSCAAADGACVAVGGLGPVATQTPFAEAWDGTRWVVETVPGAPGRRYSWFNAVSCVSAAFCVAAGQSIDVVGRPPTPFAAVRRGGVWSALPTPPGTGGRLEAVSCTTATSCHVGGWTNGGGSVPRQTVVDVWDGTAWTALPPVVGQVLALQCPTTDRCTGVGYDVGSARTAIAVVVDGVTTTRVAVETPRHRQFAAFMSVACTARLTCRAVGYDRVIQQLPFSMSTLDGGRTWTVGTTPPNPLPRLSCSTVSDCTAIGTDAYAHRSRAVRLAAKTWTVQTTADPPGVVSDQLVSVSCRAATACLAVDGDRAHLARWDGASWTSLAPPTDTTVDDVSCATTTVCLAVGRRAGVAVGALWSGGTWTVTPIGGLPAGVTAVHPLHVACGSPTRCAMVAADTSVYEDPDGSLVGSWDGRTWTVVTTPRGTDLHAVSCSSRTRCVAAGVAFPGHEGRFDDPVAAQFDGTSWTSLTLPAPSTANEDVTIDGVSCSTDGVCTVVGSSTQRNGFVQRPLLEVGTVADGWTIAPDPTPAGGPFPVRLVAVSCPNSTVCTVVGRTDDTTDEPTGAVVLRSGADGWHSQPSPAVSVGGRLRAVSCPNLGWCAAVGSAQPRPDGGRLTYAMVWNDTIPLAVG